jgi:hypothetical protein
MDLATVKNLTRQLDEIKAVINASVVLKDSGTESFIQSGLIDSDHVILSDLPLRRGQPSTSHVPSALRTDEATKQVCPIMCTISYPKY